MKILEEALEHTPRNENSAAKAAVITSPGQLSIQDLELPEPGLGQVRLRLEGSGVCASNLPVWEGREWFTYPQEPGAPGHEGWGIVDAVGADVDGVSVGQRVAALSYHAYATHDIADASAVVTLPAELDGKPFPAEPLGCAMNVFARSGVQPGQRVAIVGTGFLGALVAALCTRNGAQVIALSRRDDSLDAAVTMGAAHAVRMDDHWRAIEAVKEITKGDLCDVVIEAAGYQWPLDLASELVRTRGRLVVAGYHQDGPRSVNMQQWNWKGIDVINAHERDPAIYRQGMLEAVQAVARGQLDPSPLYTHLLPLEELGDAFRLMKERPPGFIKAILTYT